MVAGLLRRRSDVDVVTVVTTRQENGHTLSSAQGTYRILLVCSLLKGMQVPNTHSSPRENHRFCWLIRVE